MYAHCTRPGFISRRGFLTGAALGAAGAAFALPSFAQEKKAGGGNKAVEDSVSRGLEWLKRTQANDGRWEATGGKYKVAMTALAGMCFLMEGSNLKEGKYSDQVKKATDWLTHTARQRENGMIADSRDPSETDRYMHGHGFATMFLACAYGEAEDKEQLQKLEKSITKAAEFCAKAQTRRKHALAEGKSVGIGGWGYVTAADGRNYDEGSVTITQLQALRAAADTGIPVSKESIDLAVAYLQACTTSKGGVIYSYADSGGRAVAGHERPPLTVAAVACSFSAKQYSSDLAKRWIKYCKDNIPFGNGRVPHDEYQNYYFAQFVWALGEQRYGEMFPNEPKATWLTWSKYRAEVFPNLIGQQEKASGAWTTGYIGPVFATAVNLTILQLENDLLPIYRR